MLLQYAMYNSSCTKMSMMSVCVRSCARACVRAGVRVKCI